MTLPATSALLIVDIQNDFCPGGALAVNEADQIIPAVNRLYDRFGVKVLTQDWHPADHSSFADNHEGAEPFSQIEVSYGPQVLWPRHCVQGTDGAAFHRDLLTDGADLIIRKGFRPAIDSYSAFFENDKTTKTGLCGYLRERGVTSVYTVGIASDFCVYYSAIDARRSGFDVTFITDCCRGIDMDGSLDAAMDDMARNDVKFLSSGEL